MGEVLLPRRFGILSSSLSLHQRFQSRHNYRPRIQRARCLCWPAHRRLLFDELGANFSCRCFRWPCRRVHQWLLELSTLRHWRWNTTVCSNHDNYEDEGPHCKRLAARYQQTSCRKGIPVEIDWKTETTVKKSIRYCRCKNAPSFSSIASIAVCKVQFGEIFKSIPLSNQYLYHHPSSCKRTVSSFSLISLQLLQNTE